MQRSAYGKRVRGWLVVFAVLAVAANARVGRADVDLTGDWQITFSTPSVTFASVIDQNGSALTVYFSPGSPVGNGIINPASGVFSFSVYDPPCGASYFSGTASPDGNSISGTGMLAVFLDPGCIYPDTTFSGTRVSTPCGNSMLDSGETCDDGNRHAGDCCSPFCTGESAGAPCADGDACTDSACDGAGTCVAGGTVDCDDGHPCTADTCDMVLGCMHAADVRPCRSAQSTALTINTASPEAKLVWKWRKGQSTSVSEFADPLTTAAYSFCLFAGTTATIVAEATIPPDSVRWKAVGNRGFNFKDAAAAADGIRRVILRASDANRAKIVVKAKGAAVTPPPLDVPLTAQLTNGDTNVCWSATYDAPDVSRNEDGALKAKTSSP